MKIKVLICALLAAAAGMIPLQQSNAFTWTQGDLLMGFRALDGLGAGSTYILDLNTLAVGGTFNGTASRFREQTTTGVNLYNIANIGTDLTQIFGPEWNTRSDVLWGIAATRAQGTSGGPVNGDRPSTIYLSNVGTGAWLQSTTAITLGNSQRDSVAATIVAWQQGSPLQGSVSGGSPGTWPGNNTQGAVIVAGQSNSWDAFVGQAAPNLIGFNDLGTGVNIEGNFGGGVNATSLDLYRYTYNQTGSTPINPSWRGTFHIDVNGNITYAVAIPEPSSVLLLSIGAGFLMGRRRRTPQAA